MVGAKKDGCFFAVLRGVFLGAAVSLALILVFALALHKGWLRVESTALVTPVIKVVCAGLAGLTASRAPNRRLLMGAAAGLAYILLAFMLFSVLSSTFTFSWALLTDMGIGAAAGAMAALVRALIK